MITFNSYDLGNKNYKNSSAKNVAFGTHFDPSAREYLSHLYERFRLTPSKEIISKLEALKKDGLDNLHVHGSWEKHNSYWGYVNFDAYEASDPKTTIRLGTFTNDIYQNIDKIDFIDNLPKMLEKIKSDLFEKLAEARANNAAEALKVRNKGKNEKKMQQQFQNALSALS